MDKEIVNCGECKHALVVDLSAYYKDHDHDWITCTRFGRAYERQVMSWDYCSWGEQDEER